MSEIVEQNSTSNPEEKVKVEIQPLPKGKIEVVKKPKTEKQIKAIANMRAKLAESRERRLEANIAKKEKEIENDQEVYGMNKEEAVHLRAELERVKKELEEARGKPIPVKISVKPVQKRGRPLGSQGGYNSSEIDPRSGYNSPPKSKKSETVAPTEKVNSVGIKSYASPYMALLNRRR